MWVVWDSGKATLTEMRQHWDLCDLMNAYEFIQATAEANKPKGG